MRQVLQIKWNLPSKGFLSTTFIIVNKGDLGSVLMSGSPHSVTY